MKKSRGIPQQVSLSLFGASSLCDEKIAVGGKIVNQKLSSFKLCQLRFSAVQKFIEKENLFEAEIRTGDLAMRVLLTKKLFCLP